MVSKQHILEEIRRTARENNEKPLGRARFEKETGIKESDWLGKYWAKWNDVIREAGYSPNKMQSAHDSDFLLRKFVELIEEIGKFPTRPELRLKRRHDKSFPSSDVFDRFGKKHELIKAVLSYCEKNNINEQIISICNNAKSKLIIPDSVKSEDDNIDFGFVYLMKSGKHYKIGRSSSAERREYELRIIVPEKLELIHKIKTDDPVGIEKYWHKRFEDKCQRGEWFALSASDVQAFKRRKFM